MAVTTKTSSEFILKSSPNTQASGNTLNFVILLQNSEPLDHVFERNLLLLSVKSRCMGVPLTKVPICAVKSDYSLISI